MTVNDQVEVTVRSVLARVLAVDQVTLGDDASLRDDLGADSLAISEALAALERDLTVELSDTGEFVTELRTVGDVVRAFKAAA